MSMTLTERINSFFGTAGRTAKAAVTPGQDVLATPSYVVKRRAICQGCPKRDGYLCGECGCLIVAKTTLATARCPAAKW